MKARSGSEDLQSREGDSGASHYRSVHLVGQLRRGPWVWKGGTRRRVVISDGHLVGQLRRGSWVWKGGTRSRVVISDGHLVGPLRVKMGVRGVYSYFLPT